MRGANSYFSYYYKYSLCFSVPSSLLIIVALLIVTVLFLITILIHPSILISSTESYFSEGDITNTLIHCTEGRNRTTPIVGCFICNIRDNKNNELHLTHAINNFDRRNRDARERGNDVMSNSLRFGQDVDQITNISTLSVPSLQGIFDSIYNGNIWTPAGGGSGVGSDAGFAVSASHILQLGKLHIFTLFSTN